ncbi:MAG: biotin--[acetyl-CoA-carboxylase] ligase [Asgard group archaeon]|nr:biotin--[acetyl-CoA-carboxylase] ligase [Asgard group archaeon]
MKSIFQMNILDFISLESTQKTAKEFLKTEKPCHRLIIIAEEQTQGIGRLDRKWASPKGGIWMSSIFQQKIPLDLVRGFSIRIGLLLAKELSEKLALDIKVKWPNDLILADKKIGGILTELSSTSDNLNHLVVGIGLNVNIQITELPENLRETATSISNVIGYNISMDKIKNIIIETQHNLFSELENKQFIDLTPKWKDWSFTYEKEILINFDDDEIIGKEVGITKFGDLIVKLSDGTKKFITMGEIKLLRKI